MNTFCALVHSRAKKFINAWKISGRRCSVCLWSNTIKSISGSRFSPSILMFLHFLAFHQFLSLYNRFFVKFIQVFWKLFSIYYVFLSNSRTSFWKNAWNIVIFIVPLRYSDLIAHFFEATYILFDLFIWIFFHFR